MFGKRKAELRASREQEALEAAAGYLLGVITDDEASIDEAVSEPTSLMAGLADIAQRAVVALAQERGVDVRDVLTSLTSASSQTTRP